MNAFSTIDIDAPETEFSLTTVDTLTPAIVFVPGGVEKIIAKLESEVRAVPRDISTKAGREAVAALAYKVARSKTGLDDMGKDLVAGIKKQAGAIDADRRTIRDRLDALKNEVRAELTAWEAAEEKRVSDHEAALVAILSQPHAMATAAEIREHKAMLEALAGRDWQEFDERALEAFREEMPKLCRRLEEREQYDRDAAELEALRKEKAERDERDRAEAEAKERAERIERDKAEIAERERQYAERIERERAEAAERAAASAIEQERRRAAAAKAAEEAAEQKRQANSRHRAKIHREICLALSEVLTGDADEAAALIEAIAAGRITHVSITY